MLNHLFVYGSLMHEGGHAMGLRLAEEADYLGPARTAGRLYRLSWYPVGKPAAHPADILHGAVYRLHRPSSSLVWLDAYEGITQTADSAAETEAFYRTTTTAILADGRSVDTMIYFYRPERPETARIASGSWLAEDGGDRSA